MSKTPTTSTPTPSATIAPKLDPRTISISEYAKYQSYEMKKIAATFRVYKKSLLYIGGCIGLSLVSMWLANKRAHQKLFGCDYRGGDYLNLETIYDEDHYAYNREFQRMHVLGESKLGDLSKHSKQLIKDLGVDLPQLGNPHIPKKAPHEKFY